MVINKLDKKHNAYNYGEKNCIIPFEKMFINTTPRDNEKGYIFYHHPCYCEKQKPIVEKYGVESENPFELFYNNSPRKEFMDKIVQGDYSLCHGCPRFKNRSDKFLRYLEYQFFGEFGYKVHSQFRKRAVEDYTPYSLSLNLDDSCNLKCKTCRVERIKNKYIINNEDMTKLVEMSKRVKVLELGGDGEIFFGRNYLNFLSHDLSGGELNGIVLFSNGILFNERNWNKIHPNNRKLIREIKISVDSHTEDVYKVIRGNQWGVLNKNLIYINKLKKDYNFELSSTFTISKLNISNFGGFYDWAIKNGFDKIVYAFGREIFHETDDLEKSVGFIIEEKYREEITQHLDDLKKLDDDRVFIDI